MADGERNCTKPCAEFNEIFLCDLRRGKKVELVVLYKVVRGFILAAFQGLPEILLYILRDFFLARNT